jgi:hypothetical protein
MADIWWNLLRTRIRRVPQEERQLWTESKLTSWLVKFSRDREVRLKRKPLPTVEHVKRVCSDLMGPLTTDDHKLIAATRTTSVALQKQSPTPKLQETRSYEEHS